MQKLITNVNQLQTETNLSTPTLCGTRIKSRKKSVVPVPVLVLVLVMLKVLAYTYMPILVFSAF